MVKVLTIIGISTLLTLPSADAQNQSPTPSAPQEETFIEGKWLDPALSGTRTNFSFDYPLVEAVKILTNQTHQAFDVILPILDVYSIPVRMDLKNVSAVEVFRAMNLQFELSAAPVRWALIMNNERPTAVLRILPNPETSKPKAESQKRTAVIYIGSLFHKGTPNFSFEAEVKKISGAIDMASNQAGTGAATIASYPDGEMLIVTGTPEQIELVRDILQAMEKKATHDRAVSAPKSGELYAPAPRPAEPK